MSQAAPPNTGEERFEADDALQSAEGPIRRLAFVAPRHSSDPRWPWITRIGALSRHQFDSIYVDNTFQKLPKATRMYVRWQYVRTMRRIRDAELAFLFSTDINLGLTAWPAGWMSLPPRVYVGFTQDGPWEQQRIDRLSAAMQRLDAVTVFSEDERRLYLTRYRLDARRVHLIPIHTDETEGYRQYPDNRPVQQDYILSMGSPNRRFMPVARACHALGIPLVIITRPNHKNDSLEELANLGATMITNADKMKSLTYLKHAKLAAMAFETDAIPGAFTTLVHAMFLRTPFVVSSCLGMSDYVVNDFNGFVTPHNDERAMQDAIGRLWSEPGLAEQFGERSYQRALDRHSLESAAASFYRLTEHVLAGSPCGCWCHR